MFIFVDIRCIVIIRQRVVDVKCTSERSVNIRTSREFPDQRHSLTFHHHLDTVYQCTATTITLCSLLFFSSPQSKRWPHHGDVLSPFISVLCHPDWLFRGETCPRTNVVHPGRAWSSSPVCTWHCSLHYLFLQATPLVPHGLRPL